MNDAEKLDRLRLIRTENIGPATFARLLARFGTAGRALDALPDLARRGGKTGAFSPFPRDEAEKEMERIRKCGARLLAKGEDGYPPLLAQIEDAPPLITVLGHPHILSGRALGVVGARNASLAGRRIAGDFSRKASQAGYVIVSGLARGIDAAAHEAALENGTVAVVAGGIDNIYPPENEKLYRRIAQTGAIVAESPFGTEPLARHFPRRNRIISGLSLGVLIVEAAMKSGSLITARMALEQNREVFAVPGSPLDPRAEGTNSLIRDGAHLATCAGDIVRVLDDLHRAPLSDVPRAQWQGMPAPEPAEPDQAVRTRVLECLSPVPVHVDELVRATGGSAPDVLATLLELEIAGRLERQPGNRVSLA